MNEIGLEPSILNGLGTFILCIIFAWRVLFQDCHMVVSCHSGLNSDVVFFKNPCFSSEPLFTLYLVCVDYKLHESRDPGFFVEFQCLEQYSVISSV